MPGLCQGAGRVGVGEDLGLGAGERTACGDGPVKGEEAVQVIQNVARAAVVGVRVEDRPAGYRHGRSAVEVLHGILEPPEAGAGAREAEEGLDPARLEVLALVDDHLVEGPVGIWRRGGETGLQLSEDARLREVRHRARRARPAVAGLV